MKSVLICLTICLVSCQKDIWKKDARQLIGKWELHRTWENPDGSSGSKRNKNKEGWILEFTEPNNVVFTGDHKKLYGKYEHSFNEIRMHLYNDSSRLEEIWLWYQMNVTNNRLDVYEMRENIEYNYLWKKMD